MPPLPLYVFMTWCLVKHRDSFTFTVCFMRATYPNYLTVLNLITVIISDEENKLLSSSLCSFLQSPVTFYFIGRNVTLSTLTSGTLNLCSSLGPQIRDGKWKRVPPFSMQFFAFGKFFCHVHDKIIPSCLSTRLSVLVFRFRSC